MCVCVVLLSSQNRRELYDSLVKQLGPLAVRAADAVSMLKQSDINVVRLSETDATGANQAYKAGLHKRLTSWCCWTGLPHDMLAFRSDAVQQSFCAMLSASAVAFAFSPCRRHFAVQVGAGTV